MGYDRIKERDRNSALIIYFRCVPWHITSTCLNIATPRELWFRAICLLRETHCYCKPLLVLDIDVVTQLSERSYYITYFAVRMTYIVGPLW